MMAMLVGGERGRRGGRFGMVGGRRAVLNGSDAGDWAWRSRSASELPTARQRQNLQGLTYSTHSPTTETSTARNMRKQLKPRPEGSVGQRATSWLPHLTFMAPFLILLAEYFHLNIGLGDEGIEPVPEPVTNAGMENGEVTQIPSFV